MAREKTLTAAQARKVINELVLLAGDEPVTGYSARAWLDEWLEGKRASRTAGTHERYRKPLADFLAHLGRRADLPIEAINPGDVRGFRNKQRAECRASATVNLAHKAVSAPFAAAVKQGIIVANPATAVDLLPAHGERTWNVQTSRQELPAKPPARLGAISPQDRFTASGIATFRRWLALAFPWKSDGWLLNKLVFGIVVGAHFIKYPSNTQTIDFHYFE